MHVKRLKPKDTIGIICPSSYADMSSLRVQRFTDLIKKLGFNIEYGESCYSRSGYLAGSDDVRIKDIERMFGSPQIKAIICYKGGFGASRIVDKINYEIIKNNPKLFVGFSDITVLLNAIYQKTNLPTIHGMMGIVLGRDNVDDISITDFTNLLTTNFYGRILSNNECKAFHQGVVSGKLVGGNLSLINTLVGTDYDIDFTDKIVFFEEVSEDLYRIDRMFSQLRLAGKLEGARGFIFGHFTNCSHEEDSQSMDDLIKDYFSNFDKPIITNFASGHDLPFLNLPIGLEIELDANNKNIKIIEEYYEKN